jgi:hypothetical protein
MARNTPGLREAIIDKFQRYLGRTPSESEMNQFLDNHETGEQVAATIANSDEYRNGRDLTPDGTGTTPRPPAFTPGQAGDPAYDANPRDFMANRDKEQWRLNLVDYLVRTKGLSPADAERMAGEEVTGIEAAVRNERNIGVNPDVFIEQAKRKLDGRIGNTPRGGDNGGGGGGGNTGGGGGGTGGGGGDAGTSTRSASGFPTFTPPAPMALPTPYSYADYTAPAPFAYDAYTMAQPFSYAAFEAPTGQSMLSDPSYQFRLEQGQKALDASAANRGTLRTGSHLKDTIGYGQNFASQEYGNIFNRAAEQYGMNRGNAQQNYAMNEANRASTYGTNYGTAKDIYGINAAGQLGAYNTNRGNAQDAYQSQYKTAQDLYQSNYKSAQDQYNAQQRTAELQFGREWDAYKYAGDKAYDYWNANLNADTAIAGYK